MLNVEEYERKYLISNYGKKDVWDKEHIVYQWYTLKNNQGSSKDKIIFDLLRARLIYVRVKKTKISWGKSEKRVEYLDIKNFNPDEYIGIPFVLKRRAIRDNIFLDKFVRSNGITDYLLEYEGEDIKNVLQEFELIKEVTKDEKYYNQNMCVPFTKEDADDLKFLLKIYKMKI